MMFTSRRFIHPPRGTTILLQTRSLASRDPIISPSVERAIREAQQRGAFDKLRGAGKPLISKRYDMRVKGGLTPGMSSVELFSKKAEFEMQRAIRNHELDPVLHGQPLKYRGTTVVTSSWSSGSSSSSDSSTTAMEQYILKQAQPSVKDLKELFKK